MFVLAGVSVGVGVCEGVKVAVGVGVSVDTSVFVGVAVSVGVSVGVAGGVFDGVKVAVGVDEGVHGAVAVCVAVGVGRVPDRIVAESKTVPVSAMASIWSEAGETVMLTCSYVAWRKALQEGWLIRN